MWRLIILLILLILPLSSSSCRFAPNYTTNDLISSHQKRDAFQKDVIFFEKEFIRDGIGVNSKTQIAYDGAQVDCESGCPTTHRVFGAPSKESLHLGIIALALDGNHDAMDLLGVSTVDDAIEILSRKIRAYNAFNERYPGYGGFLPWVSVNDSGIFPLPDWTSRVPSLDNGEMAFGLVATYSVLAQSQPIRAEIINVLKRMVLYGNMIFYNGNGFYRAVASIKDIYATPTPQNYAMSGTQYLDDPYEGEMFVVFMDLYSSLIDREVIWEKKKHKLVAVNYTIDDEQIITVQQGYWFSSHEQWKLLYLPYLSIDIVKRVMMNCERARTWHSYIHRIPGLFASVNDPCCCYGGHPTGDYISAIGIKGIASQEVKRGDVVTPYASFPLIMLNKTMGLVWYHAMLSGGRMQCAVGSIESIATNGTLIAPLVSWDAKMTTVLAMLGGVSHLIERVMKGKPPWSSREEVPEERFLDTINRAYSSVFDDILGENLGIRAPSASLSTSLGDFSQCT